LGGRLGLDRRRFREIEGGFVGMGSGMEADFEVSRKIGFDEEGFDPGRFDNRFKRLFGGTDRMDLRFWRGIRVGRVLGEGFGGGEGDRKRREVISSGRRCVPGWRDQQPGDEGGVDGESASQSDPESAR
tara:strand:- start:907 stop:1293 length:387 start_codon:yes stop_codon:yes gene_type:complete